MLRKSTTAFVFCSELFCISFCTELMGEHSSLKKLSSLMLGIYCLSYTAPFFWDSHDFGNLFTCHSFPLIRFFCLDLLKSSECYCERKKKRQVFKDYNNSFPGSTNPMIFTHIKNKNKQPKTQNKTNLFFFRKRKPKTTYTKTWTFFSTSLPCSISHSLTSFSILTLSHTQTLPLANHVSCQSKNFRLKMGGIICMGKSASFWTKYSTVIDPY